MQQAFSPPLASSTSKPAHVVLLHGLASSPKEFGLLEPRVEGGQRVYSENEADVAAACETLSRYGIARSGCSVREQLTPATCVVAAKPQR